ncbi:fatty acyl-CoA reductase wat-like isoform X2 [Chelonus insularis]|nr:fatty acyl-CoA reductase wat-like isoform X2 [Chelonus insularis]
MNVYKNHINMNEHNNNVSNTINTDDIIKRTPIQDFYAGQNIFMTGATGFLGKSMIEKLLRTCPDLSTIYLLIRPKKNSNINDRVEDIFNEPIFEQLKKDSPKLRHKIVAVSGDCTLPGLGLSLEDRNVLIKEVSIVFHNAATVKFDETLKTATAINAGGALAVMNLCKEMKKLKAMIHVSTAYANCHLDVIEEKFYPHPSSYEEVQVLVNTLPEDAVNDILPRILQGWPNTYTFTKALAEKVIRENCQNMPVGIFRPAIIISCAEEPVPGWIDNYYGPTGVAAAAITGFLRFMRFDKKAYANMVPVDYTVNAILASAWDVAIQTDKRGENLPIYNYVSTVEAPITWGDYMDHGLSAGREFPLKQSVWYLSMTGYQNKILSFLAHILLHLFPAVLVDIAAICSGHKPRMVKAVTKVQKFLSVIQPFSLKNWTFDNKNIQALWKQLEQEDKKNFKFSLSHFDWKHYLRNHILGVRLYLFKEDLSTLEVARKRLNRLHLIHIGVQIFTYLLVLYLIWKMFTIFF